MSTASNSDLRFSTVVGGGATAYDQLARRVACAAIDDFDDLVALSGDLRLHAARIEARLAVEEDAAAVAARRRLETLVADRLGDLRVERQRQRVAQVLERDPAKWQVTDRLAHRRCSVDDLADALAAPMAEIEQAVQDLRDEGLADMVASTGEVALTVAGRAWRSRMVAFGAPVTVRSESREQAVAFLRQALDLALARGSAGHEDAAGRIAAVADEADAIGEARLADRARRALAELPAR